MLKIKGLIFDLDGTLTLSQQYHAQAFGAVFKKHGITYTAKDDLRYAGRGSHCIFPEFFAEHGIILTKEQTEEYTNEKKTIYNKIIHEAKIHPVEGAKEFLNKMKKREMKMVVASGNTLEGIETILEKTHLREFFDDIITNSDVKKSKPFPDIFLKAAEKMALKKHECIVFEDAVNGVKAAKAAGMKCICFNTTTEKTFLLKAGAAAVFKNYTDIAIPNYFDQ